MASEYQIDIGFEKLQFTFPNDITLYHLYVSDQRKDTLLYLESLSTSLIQLNVKQHTLGFGKTQLVKAHLRMGYDLDSTQSNYLFLIRHFSPPRKDTTVKRPEWNILFDDIHIVNSRFVYFDENSSSPDYMDFDPSRLDFYHIQGHFSPFKIMGDSLSFKTKQLAFKESSGMDVTYLSGNARIHSKGMEISRLKLITPHSKLGDYIQLTYDDWSDFSHFNSHVQLNIHLSGSFVALEDLFPYHHQIQSLGKQFMTIEGDIEGSIDKLKIRHLTVNALKETVIKGDFNLTGLPDLESTQLDLNIKHLATSQDDMLALFKVNIPQHLTHVQYNGKLLGSYLKFETRGKLSTNLGQLQADLSLDASQGLEQLTYGGKLATKGFDLGKLINNKQLGNIVLQLDVNQRFNTKTNQLHLEVDGSVPRLQFAGYPYEIPRIKGSINEDYFNGEIVIKDPNIDLQFKGLIDLRPESQSLNFTADIKKLHLKPLGFDRKESQFNGLITLNTKGIKPDSLNGSLKLTDFNVVRNGEQLHFDSLIIVSKQDTKRKTISISSSFLNAEIKGYYLISELPSIGETFANDLFPDLFPHKPKGLKTSDMAFEIYIREAQPILELFNPDFLISGGVIKGNYNTDDVLFKADIGIDQLQWKNVVCDQLRLSARKSPNTKPFLAITSSLRFTNSKFNAENVLLTSELNNHILSYGLKARDSKEDIWLENTGQLILKAGGNHQLELNQFQAGIKGKTWEMDKGSTLYFGQTFIIEPLELRCLDEKIKVFYSSQSNDNQFNIALSQVNISIVNDFIDDQLPHFYGVINGNTIVKFKKNDLLFESDMTLKRFAVNKDTIGDIRLQSMKHPQSFHEIYAEINSGIFNGVKTSGTLGNSVRYDAINLDLVFPETNIRIFQQFLPGISNLSGSAAGNVHITGTYLNPLLNGSIKLSDVLLTIDYLKVPFKINSNLLVTQNEFTIHEQSIIEDDKGKKAQISGFLKHADFKDWSYRVQFKNLQDFHVLNTEKKDNDLFYGQAYADGKGSLFGTFDKFNLSLQMATKSGTNIKLPIGESEASGPAPYIRFKSDKVEMNEKLTDIGFLNSLNMIIDVTPAAEFQLIFDEQTGDIIKGSGNGRITMDVDPLGEFFMRGGITIERGDYQFVAFNNFVNKRFFLQRGGTITWDGDPTQARIDLSTYNLQTANPNPLLGKNNQRNSGVGITSVQARSEIHLKGNLFRPEIDFGFDIQNLLEVGMSELSSIVQRIKNDEDEVNRQVFSLLVFGSFVVPSFISAQTTTSSQEQGGSITSGLADIISSQVDAWLSQIDPKWLVDFSFTNTNPDQRADMIFRLGRKFANDRIILDLTYGTNQAGPANNSINMEYLATRDGRVRLKAFSRTAAIYNNANAVAPVNTIGIGVFYQKEFDKFTKIKKIDTIPKDTMKFQSIDSTNISVSSPSQEFIFSHTAAHYSTTPLIYHIDLQYVYTRREEESDGDMCTFGFNP